MPALNRNITTPSQKSNLSTRKTPSPPKQSSPPPKTPSPPPTITVFVSIYNPTDDRDPSHWAIFLNGQGAKDVILQVSDDKQGVGYYVEKPMWGKYPQKSSMHQASIAVGTIAAASLRSVVVAINSQPVDNESQTWNCQAWYVEALDNLHGQFGFQWNLEARKRLIAKRQHWQ